MLNVRTFLPLIAMFVVAGCGEVKQAAPPTAEEAAAAVLEDKAAEDAEMQQHRMTQASAKKRK